MKCVGTVLLICVVVQLVLFAAAQDPNNPAQGVWLDSYVSKGARCLDGSAPLYYIRKATNPINATKWVVHQQGGAWCTSLDDCFSRSKSRLGSSSKKYWEETMDFGTIPGCQNARWCGALFLNDPEKNTLTYDWNAVFLVYCDGGSQIGNNNTITMYNGTPLYFFGFHNLDAIITDLTLNQGLDKATHVIIGGDSAGGLSTYIHTDYWQSRLPLASVVGVPDSGFFLELDSLGKKFASDMEWVFQQMNGTLGLHPSCVEYYKSNNKNVSQCIFAPNTAPFCKAPMFALQSRYDAYQLGAILGSNQPDLVDAFGTELVGLIMKNFLGVDGKNGVFLDSCEHHCGGWGMGQDGDYDIVIDKQTGFDAFVEWYTGLNQKRLWFQQEIYPCSACCTGGE